MIYFGCIKIWAQVMLGQELNCSVPYGWYELHKVIIFITIEWAITGIADIIGITAIIIASNTKHGLGLYLFAYQRTKAMSFEGLWKAGKGSKEGTHRHGSNLLIDYNWKYKWNPPKDSSNETLCFGGQLWILL